MNSIKIKLSITVIAIAVFVSFIPSFVASATSLYSSGTYGSCQYNTCGISLSSSGTVNSDVTPGPTTSCTVSNDTVTVGTSSSTGYTLSLGDFDTNNGLVSSSATIAASSATAVSPATLSANTWGYRVDNQEGFGAGPTDAISSSSTPSTTFGAVPISSSSQDVLVNATSPANPAVATSVWYGVCVDATTPAGTYTDSVVYTAVVN